MRKLIMLIALLVLGVSGVALAAGTRTVSSKGTINAAPVASAGGGKLVIAGRVKDSRYGKGAIVFDSAGVGKGAKTTFTAFFEAGAVKGTTTSDNTVSGKDLLIANGKVKITSGTGAFKKAKGTGTFSGKQTGANLQLTLKYALSYKLPK